MLGELGGGGTITVPLALTETVSEVMGLTCLLLPRSWPNSIDSSAASLCAASIGVGLVLVAKNRRCEAGKVEAEGVAALSLGALGGRFLCLV